MVLAIGAIDVDHIYLQTLGPPCAAILAGVVAVLRPPRVYGAAAVLVAVALLVLLFAFSEDGYCFEAGAEDCGRFLTVALVGWPISIAAATVALAALFRSIRRSR
jgi:hypothetical protein